MLFSMENFTKDAYNNAKLKKPQDVIKSIFLGWQSSDHPTKLNGLNRGNKAYEAFLLIEYFKEMESADLNKRTSLTADLLDAQRGDSIAKGIEELFEGWLADNYAHIGGEHDLNIYREKDKIKDYFNRLQTSIDILPLMMKQESEHFLHQPLQ